MSTISPTSSSVPISAARPSDRDLEIFRAVIIEGRWRREVALKFSLSTLEVRLLARRTMRWHAARPYEFDPPQMAWVLQLQRQQLEHQWEEAMYAWYRSQLEDTKRRVTVAAQGAKEEKQITTSTRCGDIRYLQHARRAMADYREVIARLRELLLTEECDDGTQLSADLRVQRLVDSLESLRERARLDALAEGIGKRTGPDGRETAPAPDAPPPK